MRFGIRARFFLAVSVLIPAVLALAWTAKQGVDELNSRVDDLYGRNLLTIRRTHGVDAALSRLDRVVIRALAAPGGSERLRLVSALEAGRVPAVDRALTGLAAAPGVDTPWERRAVVDLRSAWSTLRREWLGQRVDALFAEPRTVSVAQFQRAFRRVSGLSARMGRSEAAQADQSASLADRTHQSTVRRVYEISGAALLLAVAVALWLAWTIAPRVRAYSRFAERVATGVAVEPVVVRGGDELADLGHALNRMVADRYGAEVHSMRQAEFIQTMQLAESEHEAQALLKRHLERSLTAGRVTVLSRNNSEDRLEARTLVPEGSPLAKALDGSGPRDCLAVRFGRIHATEAADSALVECPVCSGTPGQTMCQPLLVGGEVIGSVLTTEAVLDSAARARVEESVAQAAPVVANLRNLAIAELRAATDALTGLPNGRSARDTARRMVAEAGRTDRPLSALMLDLDHFKQINDTYGHGAGDEVLAAVGDSLRSVIRESDFAGRYGGEEFLVLLPDTDPSGALTVAEKLRAAIAMLAVSAVDDPVTTSIGVATLPGDGYDTPSLLRAADRALYTAKANGRNRVEALHPPPVEATPTP